jgi:hypothetical protein
MEDIERTKKKMGARAPKISDKRERKTTKKLPLANLQHRHSL